MATTMERLTMERARVKADRDTLDRQVMTLDLALAEARGDADLAAYYVAVLTERYDEAHRLWVLEKARKYVETGKHSLYTCDAERGEIESAAAKLKQGQAA